jgi:hypothetical protein
MLLVGLENCKPCMELHAKHPNVPFVEIPRHAGKTDKDTFMVKKALGRFGIKEFPVIFNDDLTELLPLSVLEGINENN